MRRRIVRSRWWLIPAAFFLMCSGWALSSPTGSSPDDDYHLGSIWCTRDGQPGVCEPSAQDGSRSVPTAVVDASACYRFEIGPSAACVNTPREPDLASTTRVNQAQQLYPGGFYAALGPFVGPDVDRSVLTMRLVNAAIASLLLMSVLLLTPSALASAVTVSIVATYIPLGLFVTGSTNPSSWAVNGLLATWAFTVAWLRAPQIRRGRGLALSGALLVSALLTMASRVDANAYLVLMLIVAVTIHGWRRTVARRVRAVVLLSLASAAAVVYVATSSLAIAGVGLDGSGAPLGTSDAGLGLLLTNLVQVPVLLQGIVGGWALGWNDAAMPPAVFVSGVFVLGAIAVRGLQVASHRVVTATGIAFAGLITVPMLFLQVHRLGVGELVQPRYLLPLLSVTVATISLGADDGAPPPMRRLVAVSLGAIASASAAVASWALLHRFAAGADQPLFARDLVIGWAPASGLLPTFAVTTAATIAFVALVLDLASAHDRRDAGVV